MKLNPYIRLIANSVFKPRAESKDKEPIIQIQNKWYQRKRFKEGKLNTVSYLRAFDIGNFRYVEQNPETTSSHAKEAREGKNIIWVIDTETNNYIALIKQHNVSFGQFKNFPMWEVYKSKGPKFWDRVGEV